MEKVKYLIIGAGVSGLSFANNLESDDYLIIEKESEAGGYCRTTRRNGYVWDYAGHFFHFSHPELKAKFQEITNSDDTVFKVKDTKIFYKGEYVDYPFQKNIHQLPKEEMIDCLYDLFQKTEADSYESFLSMLYGKFGRSITEKFLRPYNEKLYACDLNTLDVDAMGRFFPYADVKDIILNMKNSNNDSYNQTFLYPKQGAAVFVEKLLAGIKNEKIHYSEIVLNINTKAKIVKTDKSEYSYEYLISSIPLNTFVGMSDIKDVIDESAFSYNQVLVFNLGFDKASLDNSIHWLYVPDKDINFYRIGFYNNIIGSEKLSMYIEIGYPKQAKISREDIDSQLNATLLNLKKMNIIDEHDLVDYESIVMNPAYVHITKNSLCQVEKITKTLQTEGVYFVGRYGLWKYCSIEDCMVDSLNTIKKIG